MLQLLHKNSSVNIASPAFKANPHPFYARLRAESPVFTVVLPDKQTAWLVTRYDDVVAVLKDERFAKDRFRALSPAQLGKQPWIPEIFVPLQKNMLDLDPPDHTRLRALVHKVFTPRLIEDMRERVQALTESLFDRVQSRGKMDLIRDYALPLPTTIISEMLGVDARDRHKFHRWSYALLSAEGSKWGMLLAMPSGIAFLRYVKKLVKTRRAHPGNDLTSALVAANEAGDQLSEDELLSMIFLLLIAGHETTVNLIGNGMLALLDHPEQMEKLRQDPSLIRSGVEELLRFDGPLDTATPRFTSTATSIAGVTIPQGSFVFAVLASANRDHRQFRNPDTLDLTREDNKHLAFGLGIHYCLGAPLARLEGQIAINTLLRRAPRLRQVIPREALQWRRGLVLRGLESLPVRFAGRA